MRPGDEDASVPDQPCRETFVVWTQQPGPLREDVSTPQDTTVPSPAQRKGTVLPTLRQRLALAQRCMLALS
jgi:hypothetical protein